MKKFMKKKSVVDPTVVEDKPTDEAMHMMNEELVYGL